MAVWCADEAGPYQAIPPPGPSVRPAGEPARYPHEYVRGGTAKRLTVFHPATGPVRVKGVTRRPHAILHPWLEAELSAIVATLPRLGEGLEPAANRAAWARWQEGRSACFTRLDDLPP